MNIWRIEVGNRMKTVRHPHTDTSPDFRWLSAQLDRLERVASLLGDHLRADKSLGEIARIASEAFDNNMCSVHLMDDVGTEFRLNVSVGLSQDLISAVQRLPLALMSAGPRRSGEPGEIKVIEDVRADPIWSLLFGRVTTTPPRAVWSAPICMPSGAALGLLSVYYQTRRCPEPQDLALGRVFARHLAAAVANSRLYERAELSRTELESTEHQYRTLVEQASVGIFIADPDGRLLDVNPMGCAMLGYSRDEILSLKRSDLVAEEFAAAMTAEYKQLSPGLTISSELELKGKESVLVPVEMSAKMLSDNRTLMIARDIAARKANEEALRRRDALLRSVTEATSILLTVTDLHEAINQALAVIGEASTVDRVYVFESHINPESGAGLYSQRYEWARETVKAQPDNPVFQNIRVDTPGLDRWHSILVSGTAIGGPVCELPQLERDFLSRLDIFSLLVFPIFIDNVFWGFIGFDDCHAERRWSENEESILKAAAGTIGAAIARRRAEEELRWSEERFSKAFSTNPNPMSISRLKDGRFTAVNDGFSQALGYTREEIVGRSGDELGIWADPSQRSLILKLLREQGAVRDLEIDFLTRNGEPRVAVISADIVLVGGEECVLATPNDITERKRTEHALRRSEERFSKAFNASPLSMTILTLDTGRYIAINDSFLRLTGYLREEVIGRTANDLRIWADLDDRKKVITSLKKGFPIHDLEVKFRMRNNDISIGLFSAEIIELGGEKCVLTTTNDITERKRTDEALRASEERFSKAFNASPLPMSIITLERGCYIDANDAFLKLTGYDRSEVIGRSIKEVAIWNQVTEMIGKPGVVRDLEAEFRTRSGEVHTGLFSAEIIELDGERCILTTTNDISERKEREEELSRARVEWQATFDAMTDNVMLIDLEDRLIRANRAFYERVGQPPEECIGRSVSDLLHQRSEELLGPEQCPICDLRSRKERGVIELPAGVVASFPMFASIDPIIDTNGKTTAVVQVTRNLSDLYEAREEAERDRNSLIATIEQMAEGLIVCNEKGLVIHANRHAQEIFGYSLDEMRTDSNFALATNVYSDLEGSVYEVTELPIQVALREQSIVDSRQLWFDRADGERLLLSVTASPFFTEQKLAGAVALVRDVTEQQRERERSEQADKLRALGQLASGVAHNFNNALAAVIGYTQLGLRKVKDQEVIKFLTVIEQSAKDAARMVERIQNFSRRHSGVEDFIPVAIYEVVRDAIEITRPRWCDDAEALGIKYEVPLNWSLPKDLMVYAEPSELREVFVNIIFNGLDAMPSGGSLEISAEVDGANTRLIFADQGVGMTEEIKRRVFEPFFTTKGVAGLGMGMSESYRIVERHGGRIDIESQLHQGTTLIVVLPLVQLSAGEARSWSPQASIPKMRAIVVDDEESVRDVLGAILTEEGHEVVEASSAEEALMILTKSDYDVAFVDLAMPRIDGIAAAAEMKSRKPEMKIVLISGYGATRAYERSSPLVDIDAAISKPFDYSEIQDVLRRLLTRT